VSERPVTWLTDALVFPPVTWADENGLLAAGGDLRPERLILAYSSGIFPWPHEDMPLLWFAPDPRCVFVPDSLRVSRSLRARLRRGDYGVRLDTAFREVIVGCAETPRPAQPGTWITGEMIEAYTELHRLGLAHSAEAWRDGNLVGGAYGISLGGVFMGESMFSRETDASKVAFVTLVRQLAAWGIDLVDGQLPTSHLASLGGLVWPRERYLRELAIRLERPTRRGPWTLEISP
jgi:leucyl/phenylalanyl-tRNA--protein transferase